MASPSVRGGGGSGSKSDENLYNVRRTYYYFLFSMHAGFHGQIQGLQWKFGLSICMGEDTYCVRACDTTHTPVCGVAERAEGYLCVLWLCGKKAYTEYRKGSR